MKMTTDDNKRVIVLPHAGPPFSFVHEGKIELDTLQKLVDGRIEATYFRGKPTLSAWGNDEARIFGQPRNYYVTEMHSETYGYSMLGRFVITDTDEEGYSIPLNISMQAYLLDAFGLTFHTWDEWDSLDALRFLDWLDKAEDPNEWRSYDRLPAGAI